MCQTREVLSKVRKLHFKLNIMQIKSRFLNSCISEGLIPKGFRVKFNLAFHTKNESLPNSIKKLLNEKSSRILDLVYSQSVKETHGLEAAYGLESERLLESVGNRREWRKIVLEYKKDNANAIDFKKKTLKRKLLNLRNEKMAGQNMEICLSTGSLKLTSFKYIKEEDSGIIKGAPFPRNLRPHRRNRPHKKKNPARAQFVSSPEEVSQRDPIILTKNPNFELSEAGKSLMRLGPKTAPTPRGPPDEKTQYEAFVKFREAIRWNWFFNKQMQPEEITHDHVSQPWDEKTLRQAPTAQDCPELESFFNGMEKDLFSPALRKKVKDNLTPE